jgi:hypothetical protein
VLIVAGSPKWLGSIACPALAQLRPPHRHRADPGLSQALKPKALPNQSLAAQPVRHGDL